MAFIVFENVRGYFNSRPPVVVFMICLAAFAIALITFAYIVKTRDIPNPDRSEDWNSFLEKFSKVDFCISNNATEHGLLVNNSSTKVRVADLSPAEMYQSLKNTVTPSQPSLVHPKKMLKRAAAETGSSAMVRKPEETSTVSSTVSTVKEGIMNVTVLINVEVIPTPEFRVLPLSTTQLVGYVSGKTLKLTGGERNQDLLVTINFPQNLSSSACEEMRDDGMCLRHTIIACVQFSGPASMLPHTKKPEMSEICQAEPEIVTESTVRNMIGETKVMSSSKYWCTRGSRLKGDYSLDESLTVFLSLHDRSMINLHLMRTSYFLFVMVVTLFCYAMIKGRPTKFKTVHIPYTEKIPSQA